MTRRLRRYTGEARPARLLYSSTVPLSVSDGKIPGRITVPCKSRCLEFVTTSGRRSSDPSAALVYWGGSTSPTSLHITTSRASIYVDDRKHRRTIRTHPLLSIRVKYQSTTTATAHLYQQLIQRLRDTRQEQDRVI